MLKWNTGHKFMSSVVIIPHILIKMTCYVITNYLEVYTEVSQKLIVFVGEVDNYNVQLFLSIDEDFHKKDRNKYVTKSLANNYRKLGRIYRRERKGLHKYFPI